MVQNYKRKTERANWSEDQMKLAISAVQKKEMSLRQAAAAYSCLQCAQRFFQPQSKGKLKSLSEEDNIKNNFNSDNKMAGRDFVAGFLKRHPRLSIRKPEAVSINRVFGLHRTSINIYFDNLKTVLDQYQFQPHEILNCDESGLTCVHKPVKVIAPKGKRCVSSATSAERGQTTTTILTGCSASGVYVPPMMIFKRKRNKPELVDHAPVGTIGRCSPNGWIDTGLFLEYLKHFVAHTKCSKGSPVLLILDGHKTHTKSVASIHYARDNGVVLLSLPPHTSHKLQPLDRSFFKPLKAAFNAACSTWLRQHPGRRITVDQLGELFSAAYLKLPPLKMQFQASSVLGLFQLTQIFCLHPIFWTTHEEMCNHPQMSSPQSMLLHQIPAKVQCPTNINNAHSTRIPPCA